MLTHIDLFSGIGGFSLAAQWAGFRTVLFCEIDEFCQEVLKERFGAVADTEAILPQRRKLGQGKVESWGNYQRPIFISDIRDLDGREWRGATLLTGGFPCQPFSVAGKRRGKEDDRHLWPEMLRVITEAKPTWVLGENVAGIVNMELEQVCADLEAEGYEVQPLIIPACAVNAPHRRDRVWIIARNGKWGLEKNRAMRRQETHPRPSISDSNAPNTNNTTSTRQRGNSRCILREPKPKRFNILPWEIPWPEVATSLCRVDDGLPAWVHSHRVARLKALGNSIVPQIACEIVKEIAGIENSA